MKRLGLLLLLLTACVPSRTAQQRPAPQGVVERTLREIVAGAEVPPDLSVTYSDMHGMWGGTTISLSATGAYDWQNVNRETGPERIQGSVPEERLRELVALLVELRAWQQVTPLRQPVPDESAAGLVIRVGGSEARMWEWFNDMQTNGRLSRIRGQMAELRTGLRPGGGPTP